MLLKNLPPVDNIVTSTQAVFPDSALTWIMHFKGLRIYHGLNFIFWVKAQRVKMHANYAIIHRNYFLQAFEVHNPGLKFFPPSEWPGAMPGPKLEKLKGCFWR